MKRWIVLGLCGTVVAAGCRRGEGEEPGARDTLSIEVPSVETFEGGARRIGGRVGETLERTGQAVERAGERLREEAGEPVMTGDTL